MDGMLAAAGRTTLLVVGLLSGLPWLRSSSAVPADGEAAIAAAGAGTAASRVVFLSVDSPEYRALAIPRSYKTDADATMHLVVFRDGLVVRDRGIVKAHKTGSGGGAGTIVLEETGIAEQAAIAADALTAVVASTRYVSRVDMTPGNTSTENDTVRSATTLTLVDPAHPDGRWQLTLEEGRWVRDLVTLPAAAGVAVTTFVPRNGPVDLRLLDGTGRERIRVPDTMGETLRVEASPEGGFVAAELAFADGSSSERGITVFDVARSTQWTYGWRYGTDEEPTDWTLERGGFLSVRLASGSRRFGPTGRRR